MLENEYRNILLQPRLCTLRWYNEDRLGVVKRKNDGSGVSRFFETMSEYIESSKKSQNFEIILGRFAMVIFTVTVALEVVTGNSVLRKLDWWESKKSTARVSELWCLRRYSRGSQVRGIEYRRSSPLAATHSSTP
ncbi:Stress enhanced protein 2, chloroplastic [Linum perenne]